MTSKEYIAFYNLENLRLPDSEDSQNAKRWTEKRYAKKVEQIAEALYLMKQSKENQLLMLGVCEVEGRKPLEDLVAKVSPWANFGMVHYVGNDSRGMDVALLYDASKVREMHSETMSFAFEDDEQEGTRDVLCAILEVFGSNIGVFVVHLPSQRKKNINVQRRAIILQKIKSKILEFKDKGVEQIIIMGDFNDNPDSELLANFSATMFNPFQDLFREGGFSICYARHNLLFDQMIILPSFLAENSVLEFHSAEIFSHPRLSHKERKKLGRPYRTFAGTRYLGGFSDHFPVVINLKINNKQYKKSEK